VAEEERTPVRDKDPRDAIVLDDLEDAPGDGRVGDTPNHSGDADVGYDDGTALCLGEQNGVGC
jgi:hypothetical protein